MSKYNNPDRTYNKNSYREYKDLNTYNNHDGPSRLKNDNNNYNEQGRGNDCRNNRGHLNNNERNSPRHSDRNSHFNSSRNNRRERFNNNPYNRSDSRSRQASRIRDGSDARHGLPAREEQENLRSSLPQISVQKDDFLASWDDESFGTQNWNEASNNPSLLRSNSSKEASGIVKGKESKSSTDSSTRSNTVEQADDEEDVVWVLSSPSSILNTSRPLSPPYFLDNENNNKVSRNNKEKSRAPQDPQDQHYDEEFFNNGEDEYKGISFPPPYPIVPVPSDNEQSTTSPGIDRIFENDSRSSAQSFDNLSKIAKSLWSESTDVPLDLASKKDVNADDYLKVNGEKLKEVSIESKNESDMKLFKEPKRDVSKFSNMSSRNPELINDRPSLHKPNPLKRGDFQFASKILKKSSLITTMTIYENDNSDARSVSKISTSTTLIQERTFDRRTISSRPSRHNEPKEVEEVRNKVNNIFHAASAEWLNTILSQAHYILPKILYFDNSTIQTLLRILSAPTVLDQNNVHKKKLISYVVEQENFLEKITSYMREEVNYGGDLVPIIRLTESIIKLFPEAGQRIPYEDITEVYMKVKDTFNSKAESDEAAATLQKIEMCWPKVSAQKSITFPQKNVAGQHRGVIVQRSITLPQKSVDRSTIVQQQNQQQRDVPVQQRSFIQEIVQRKGVTDQKIPDQKRERLKKPDWIIDHDEKRIEKSIDPLLEDIFNFRGMLTEPILTSHLANRSWLPEYEETYRQIHYDLLRAEVIEDLQRASVSYFADICKDYKIQRNSPFFNYIYYKDVRVVETCIDKNFTPYVKVGFKPSRPVDWIKGEHLIYGTFVLLFKIKTEFNNLSADISNMTWAMVEHFNLDDVTRPNNNHRDPRWRSRESFVRLNFSSSEFEKLDINGKYVMLESTRNYASIRPIMEWLKESSIQRFVPLYRELFTCTLGRENTENKFIPGYLENVSFDITSILVDQRQRVVSKDLSQWPAYSNRNGPAYNMERTCVVALRHIISNKVAVIMAPIITSKAKVASKAVELLSQALQQSHCHEPILILTHSSYALDSILEQLLPSFPDLIRCGSLSKFKNPALKSRQIQDLVDENLNKTNLRRGWKNICYEINNKQKELSELWKLKKYALSLLYFIKSCPKGFRDQLSPMDYRTRYKNLGFYSENAMLARCLELWLSGILVTENTLRSSNTKEKQMGLTEDFPDLLSSSGSRHMNSRAWSNVVQDSNLPHQGKVLDNKPPNLAVNNPNFLFTKEMMNENMQSYNAQIPSPLFEQLLNSYLFENDWMKSNGCNDDEISIPSDSDKEILDHQIDDRVIFRMEDCHQMNYNNNSSKYETEFFNVAKGFWSNSGKNIWEMRIDERKSLYDRFCQRHIDFFDLKIRDLQNSVILDAETAKSNLIARWTEVCSFTPVIGMTINYATAYRELITTIKPRICIVDEASEIFESQLMYLISSDRLEHLIMFGDTQYSKPDVKGNVTQKHGLDVSLFERWIKCDGKTVCLKQQSRMHPAVHELVRTFYDEEATENIETTKIPKIMGVPSNVFFMTHDNFDDANWTSFKKTNNFEAQFIIKFAFYLYQQGYDPAKITILTPYIGQKLLILNSLKPELKRDLSKENIFGRFDKERNQVGKIRVELIDNYVSEENDIVLLSLVAVSRKWHREALKTLDNKKRAIIALSRALHALYIFGNKDMLCKSGIWSPIVKLMTKKNTFGKSLILSCDTHVNQRIEITSVTDFEVKVPFGGCSEPCCGLLKCGHACQRNCHPIHHKDEIHYICKRPCGGQHRPEGCQHKCPNNCHECEKLGKCPPCEQFVRIRLSCNHIKSMPCRRAFNEDRMNVECNEVKKFTFNCGHSSMLPCSTRYPMCQETCGKAFPCGHRCQRQCGTEHTHERSDCLSECTKVLICGHQCANGCNEPNRHTSFCNKQCRIKCLHGHICPKSCYEACTRCLEPCPWACQHHRCNRRCYELCDRQPCNKRCQKILKCGHPCNGYCGEKCPPCLKCNPSLQCRITLLTFSEMDDNEGLYVLPECNCVFITSGLDSYFENQVKNGDHTAVKLWQCPGCQEPIFTAMRYNRYLKSEINLWNIIKHKQEMARNSLSTEERKQIINAMNEETRSIDLNNMVGGRWFVCPKNHPYYIGNCGGATQISKCPDCSATIGGTQHRVINSNRFYGEFDNSSSPAWPGQH